MLYISLLYSNIFLCCDFVFSRKGYYATLFCQLVILHSDECRMTGEYATYQDIEYPIIYAK